jgi:hypothetical protein
MAVQVILLNDTGVIETHCISLQCVELQLVVIASSYYYACYSRSVTDGFLDSVCHVYYLYH